MLKNILSFFLGFEEISHIATSRLGAQCLDMIIEVRYSILHEEFYLDFGEAVDDYVGMGIVLSETNDNLT